MRDRYQQLVTSSPGRFVARRVGLPQPPTLRRYHPGDPIAPGPVVVGGTGRLAKVIGPLLTTAGVTVHGPRSEPRPDSPRPHAMIFDATGVTRSEDLHALFEFFGPRVRSVAPNGRIIVLGTPPEDCAETREATAQRALEGFTRSTGKEIKRGVTTQLVYVAPGAEDGVESTLRFLLSGRSAYVSGQVIRVGTASVPPVDDWQRPLAGKIAVVTGAARGIGEAIVDVLARDGAHVVCIDVPSAGSSLAEVAGRANGSTLTLDVTAEDAPRTLAEHLPDGVDVFVHNAGVTRDRTLGRMDAARWDLVLDVNLSSEERINDVLLGANLLRPGGRIVATSSMAGIAGNPGQTNYATSKAGVIGMVQSLAPSLASRGGTINAVAPGFIETQMTAAIPLVIREAGRRMNSMTQGGRPVDVAETIAWFASPASAGLNGNVVRVCGQSLLGA
ncbi:3-oxoacyl-ACP reductase [Cryptosporangium phraense]|uniref:3-oxoacyl-ACP reductase n=1 Tax=Cryptosporangium phraense TaxID=2593070 RepID=A0A545AQH1_9ACTN|nr:3-oxoacyl-ACP reductase [Cryptosporangium phraense]TQS43533.1 3-oxoacyl-ACP reductase [Cryptosporangium phraense]